MTSSINSFILICILITHSFSGRENIALLISNNQGLDKESPLRYTQNDISRMKKVLTRFGNFSEKNVTVSKNRSINEVTQSIHQFKNKINNAKNLGKQVFAFIYYSGHGGSDNLHIKGEKLNKKKLFEKIQSLDAELVLFIIDACQSGTFLRGKGGKIVQKPPTQSIKNLNQQGKIIITSSSAGEFSQESEEYRGSVFSYHLYNGLLGGADYNQDHKISIWEAFQFAETSTKLEFIGHKEYIQNPQIDVDVIGASNVYLSEINQDFEKVEFKGFNQGVISIYNSNNMNLEYKTILPEKKDFYQNLPRKEYLITYELENQIQVAKINFRNKGKLQITPSMFQQTSKSELMRKGGGIIELAPLTLGTFFALNNNPITDYKLYGIQFGFKNYKNILKVSLGANYYYKEKSASRIDNTIFHIGLGYSYQIFTTPIISIQTGLKANFYMIWQDINQYKPNHFNLSQPKDREFFTSIAPLFEEVIPITFSWHFRNDVNVYLEPAFGLTHSINSRHKQSIQNFIQIKFGIESLF